MENQNALKMQEGDTLAYNLSGESVRALWAKIDLKKSKYHRLTKNLKSNPKKVKR